MFSLYISESWKTFTKACVYESNMFTGCRHTWKDCFSLCAQVTHQWQSYIGIKIQINICKWENRVLVASYSKTTNICIGWHTLNTFKWHIAVYQVAQPYSLSFWAHHINLSILILLTILLLINCGEIFAHIYAPTF